MPYLNSAQAKIHYLEQGTGETVLLIHGLASSATHSWLGSSWMERLAASFKVVAIDVRGHGQSEIFYEPAAYALDKVMADSVALLDYLEIKTARVMGYSMGGWLALGLAVHHPERVRAVVAGGTGAAILRPADPGRIETIARALLSGEIGPGAEHAGSLLRLCQRTGNDPRAIAAFFRRPRGGIDEAGLRAMKAPALLAAGFKDPVSRDLAPLLAAIGQAQLLAIEGRDHMNALGDRRFKEAVEAFFRAH